jgi:hypothetical protein
MILPQEPLGIRRTGSSPVSRYSCLHSHFSRVHRWVTPPLHSRENAPLPIRRPARTRPPPYAEPDGESRSFGAVLEPRYIIGAGPLDQ